MLSFPTQTISAGAVQVDGTLDPEDKVWLESDVRPAGTGIKVSGRLSEAGPGRFYFSGTFAGSLPQECRRCLGDVLTAVTADTHVLFADGEHVDDDDPDVLPLSRGRTGSEIDLRPMVRQEWLLEVPALALCRPECKGLCLTCGANLNQGPCTCARKSDE
ncbi:MAG: DUF177 domain-containing protein [Gemmatimonadetes bacterium]|nr:DUF177 domain-containing protein [Gemmatimonadota bacterium]